MTDADFGLMAYREGNVAQIRAALLDSAKAGGIQERAEDALVAHIRANPSKTEAAWLKRYDAVRADIWLHGSSNARVHGGEPCETTMPHVVGDVL